MRFPMLIAIFSAAVALHAQVAQTGATPPAVPNPKGRLEGRVLSSATGEPVRKATLRLRMVGTVGIATGPADNSTMVGTSDAEGKFVFEEVDAGRYSLSAERSGFVQQTYNARSGRGATPLTFDAGQQIKDIVFKLVPQAVISGKVVDEDGDPIQRVQIQALRYVYNLGKRQLMPTGGVSSNPDGTFMIGNLAAGRYYLAATEMRAAMMGERTTAKGPVEGYVMTYFPSAIDASAAAPVDIIAGQELRGMDIRMRKQPVYSIRGTISAPAPAKNVMLMLVPTANQATFMMGRNNAMVREKDGGFEFSNVAPGTYLIQSQNVRINGENSAPLVARHEVTVGDHNIEDLVVALSPMLELSGTIKIEGGDWNAGVQQAQQRSAAANGTAAPGTPGSSRPQPTVQLMVSQGGIAFNGAPNAHASDDGTFQVKNVAPEKYRVSVFGIPDGTYVKSIRFAGQDVARSDLDLTSGSGGQIEVLISPNAADLSGVVRDSNGASMAGVMITMWNPANEFEPPKGAGADQNGAFKIRNVAPGDYKLIAWEDLEPGLAQNPDFRKRFDTQAISVSLKDNSHESVEVKVTPKDVIDAEVAKVS